MADYTKQDRKNLDVLMSGGTRREVKKAAKARHPDTKLKVRVGKTDAASPERELLYSVTQKTRKGKAKITKGKVKRVIVTKKKELGKRMFD